MAAKETPQRSGFSGATGAAPFREPPFLWVELTRDPSVLFHDLCDLYPGHRISGHEDLRLAIEKLSPSFICFDHDRREATAYASSRRPVLATLCPARHADERPPEGDDGPGLWSGASSYVVKPIALHELRQGIRTVLALGREHAQSPAGPRQQGYRPNLKTAAPEDRTTPCREPPRRSSVSNRASPKTSASRI